MNVGCETGMDNHQKIQISFNPYKDFPVFYLFKLISTMLNTPNPTQIPLQWQQYHQRLSNNQQHRPAAICFSVLE